MVQIQINYINPPARRRLFRRRKGEYIIKPNTIKATVSGTDCMGEAFTTTCEFTLHPPEDSNHYGTGYYMTVKTPENKHLVDVRYERTTDIETLADRWIKSWFGENAKEVVKEFHET